MGALGGILIADYWVVRRQQLLLEDLFREQGAYTYAGGDQPAGGRAFVIAIAAGGAGVRPRGDDAGRAGGRSRTSSTGSTPTPGSSRSG